ncbi:MAG TPA: ribbon-helix-helix domain-containing protein [Acidobacteriota bacterium]|nr:ribbon-helix-helix domain-containing protein [Acidobacteriota bacterium]
MRTTKTISISLPPDMLKEAEKVAKEEGRTKSELVREALPQYMRAREWDDITAYGRARGRYRGRGCPAPH